VTGVWSFGALQGATGPLSLSGLYPLRWPVTTWLNDGAAADPRELIVPTFQLVVPPAPGAEATFGAWEPGAWEDNAPTSVGPFAIGIPVGAGATGTLAPAEAGVFTLYGKMTGAGEAPIFVAGNLVFEAP